MTTINDRILEAENRLAILREVRRCSEEIHYNSIEYTATSMSSESWIERLYCEYWQTKFRYEKLNACTSKDKLMNDQCSVMKSYLQIMHTRLVNIGFDLEVLGVD